jgi:C4-dicarboxylate-binding protein DctP
MSSFFKSVVFSTALGFVAAFGLVAGFAADAAEFTARFGSQDPPTTAKHAGLIKAAAIVKSKTNGAVDIQVFPSSQLGNGGQITEGVQLGTIQGAIIPAAFLGGFNPVVSILDIPYIMPSNRATARKLRNGAFGAAVLDSFRKRGFEPVMLWGGARKVFTSNKPLPNVAAIAGQRFRVMNSKILIEQFNGLGASAIALPFGELYVSLQNGVIDGQENPLDIIERMKFFEVQKYVVVSDHGAIVEVIFFNSGWWGKLPKNYQGIIKAAFHDVALDVEKGKIADATKSLAFIRKAGLNVRIAGEAEREEIRSLAYPPARDAYIANAGAEGRKLIEIFERELAAAGK